MMWSGAGARRHTYATSHKNASATRAHAHHLKTVMYCQAQEGRISPLSTIRTSRFLSLDSYSSAQREHCAGDSDSTTILHPNSELHKQSSTDFLQGLSNFFPRLCSALSTKINEVLFKTAQHNLY